MSTINTTSPRITTIRPTTTVGSTATTNRSSSTPTTPIPTTLTTPVQNITQQTMAQVGLTPTPAPVSISMPTPIPPPIGVWMTPTPVPTAPTPAPSVTPTPVPRPIGSVGMTPVPVGVMEPGITVWGSTTATEARQQLSDARTRWANKGITNYSLQINSQNTSATPTTMMDLGKSATVDIINGQVVGASNPYSTEPADTALAKLTVNDLFDLAEKAINAGNFSDIYFDERGIPTNIHVGDKQYQAYLQSVITPATSGNDTVTIATPNYPGMEPGVTYPAPVPVTIGTPALENKTYWGGEGQDTAVLSGKLSDYTLQTQSDGTIVLTPINGPSVTLKAFETFQFADTSLTKEQITDPAQMLNYRRQQWQSQGLTNYSLGVGKSTNNNDGRTITADVMMNYQSAKIDVINGRVVNAETSDMGNTTLSPELANMTIDSLFDMAQQAINRGEKVDIQYSNTGIPQSVRIGSTQYHANIHSKITAGTTGNDTFTAQFTPYSATTPYSLPENTRYVGDSGDDTLKINGRLQDFQINQNSTTQNGSFTIYNSSNNSPAISTSGIEHLQFNDTTIDAAQLKPQMLNYYQQQWNNAPLKDYTLELTKNTAPTIPTATTTVTTPTSPIANPDSNRRTIIEVKNGQIASITAKDYMGNTLTPDPEFANFTVEKLFDLAQQGLAANDKSTVYYDSKKSYPQSIQVAGNNGNTTYYNAQVRVPGEPENIFGYATTTGGMGSFGTATTGTTGGIIPTPVPTPTTPSIAPPSQGTATGATPTSGSIATPTPTANGATSTHQGSNNANANRPKIDPQVLTRLLTALIQLIKNMQANNQTNTAHNNTVNSNASQRIRN
ncbi:DUF6174 domain-containing protein [Thiofilum flexile]|uniref:DUF6174 domain-containing protein n=1 Tax=Thiofilum flexile TaxID=125627 RepID=UPI000382AF8C|nr:DUF6174 domain-containing protein [Thiofilum flexile]